MLGARVGVRCGVRVRPVHLGAWVGVALLAVEAPAQGQARVGYTGDQDMAGREEACLYAEKRHACMPIRGMGYCCGYGYG